ncbi:hypothetical protein [Nocardiopsis tropica]|uniref:Uncharacterized protein n=1 Tax=Nocardiopsis tropica TaxID=109330 RepID=A0ABU7KL23_9ACTN|nr:hypothetical protein [Nocardiopsis umidischolae]MEE2049392.1 hypothetical protein [Nocardiopsis umidischolae]
MRQFSAALLSRALGPLTALLTPPRGRHSAAAARRRRRSTRVRRYAPVPIPATVGAAAPARTVPVAGSSDPLLPAPRLTPPPERLPADELALVRPYFDAHERELDRVREEAAARLRRWTARAAPPSGDLLATAPSTPAPAPVAVPAPRAPLAACEDPDDWRAFARLTRVWLDQQARKDVAA